MTYNPNYGTLAANNIAYTNTNIVYAGPATYGEYTVTYTNIKPVKQIHTPVKIANSVFGDANEGVEPLNEDSLANENIFLTHAASEILAWYPRDGQYKEADTITQRIPAYFNVRDLLASFFLRTYYTYKTVDNWRNFCIGISGESGDAYTGQVMPMFDYDRATKSVIKKDIAFFQNTLQLGPAWLYKTLRGYHVYFPCDWVSKHTYSNMLQAAKGCEEFKNFATHAGYGVLRVSAKYTKFDINLVDILVPKCYSIPKQPHRKGKVAHALIQLGKECGTHLASQFPLQAPYKEDVHRWKRKNPLIGTGGKLVEPHPGTSIGGFLNLVDP